MTFFAPRATLLSIALAVVAGLNCTAATAQATEVLSYRLMDWKSNHYNNAKQATTFLKALQNLGCEAKQHRHNNHTDVTYRCPKWVPIRAADHAEAHRWAHWLKSAGFETVFTQFAPSNHLKSVSFQLTSWKAQHVHDQVEAERLADTLSMLGCEVKRAEHAGHFDVTYRCEQVRTIALESDEEARVWQDWLKKQGFATRHQHQAPQTAAGTSGTPRNR